ncbi:MAG: hypothetical protein U1D30_04835 [Planctomycetota bacterium]
MYDQMIENFRKAGESSLQLQKDLFKQWSSSFFGNPFSAGTWMDQKSKLQKEYADTITDLTKRQKAVFEARFDAGLSLLEGTLALAQASDPKEFKAQSESLLKKSLEKTKELAESELRQAQATVEKCMSLATRPVS